MDSQQQQSYTCSLACNGNGACNSWQLDEAIAMCPSYKATKNKLYSPQGRAALLREANHNSFHHPYCKVITTARGIAAELN